MKRFLEYINEIFILNFDNKDSKVLDQSQYKPTKNEKKISETPSGHHIYQYNGKNNSVVYYAHNPNTKKIDMHLSGYEYKHKNKPSTITGLSLSGRKGSSLKAHEFYHHLITHHDKILEADRQSEGGRKVWIKLSKMPGIHIHGFKYDTDYNGHGVVGNPSKKLLYYSNNSQDNKSELRLVAHKEIKK